jgi:hypothetical protein
MNHLRFTARGHSRPQQRPLAAAGCSFFGHIGVLDRNAQALMAQEVVACC